MDIKIKNNEATLCCGREKCPVVTKESEGEFTIADDFGNIVQLTKDQILLVSEAAKNL